MAIGRMHIMIELVFEFHGYVTSTIINQFRNAFPAVLIANVGYVADSAEKEISEGNVHIVAFGRL